MIIWAIPMIDVRGLFISWATPERIPPSDESFSAWMSWRSIRFFSLMSLIVPW